MTMTEDFLAGLNEMTSVKTMTSEFIAGLNEMTSKEELQVVTEKCDGCEGYKWKTYKVTTEEYMLKRPYKVSDPQRLYTTTVKKILPQKFSSVSQIESFMRDLKRTAGRDIDDVEMELILRIVSRKGSYELVCVMDDTRRFKELNKWERC